MRRLVYITIWFLGACGDTATDMNLRGGAELGINNADGAAHFEPGTLNVDTTVTMSAAEDLSKRDRMELGADMYEQAGESMSVYPSDSVDPANPYAIAIEMPDSAGLYLQDAPSSDNVVVIYEAISYSDKQRFAGIIPRSELTIEGDQAMFMFPYFGSFQAVRLRETVSEAKIVMMDDSSNKMTGAETDLKKATLESSLKQNSTKITAARKQKIVEAAAEKQEAGTVSKATPGEKPGEEVDSATDELTDATNTVLGG